MDWSGQVSHAQPSAVPPGGWKRSRWSWAKYPGLGLVAPLHGAGVGLQFPHDDLEKGRLADAVGAHDRQPVAALHRQVHPVEYLVVAESLLHPLHGEHLAAAAAPLLQLEGGVAARAGGQLHHALGDPVDHPLLAPRLARLRRLGPEAVDEPLVVGDLPLAVGDLLLAPLALAALGLEEGGVVPGVELHRLVVDVEDAGRNVVEEPVVVGDDHQHAREVAQPRLQPADGQDVQVIGGLVQQQGVGLAGQHLGQQHPQLEAPGKGGQGIVVDPRRQAEALEDRRGAGLGGVPVEVLGPGLQLGEPVGVEGLRGPGEQGLLLGQDLPQLAVAHEGHVEDGVLLVQEVVLAQHPDAGPLGPADLAGAGVRLPREDVEQRRLAGAVGAHQAVALPPC